MVEDKIWMAGLAQIVEGPEYQMKMHSIFDSDRELWILFYSKDEMSSPTAVVRRVQVMLWLETIPKSQQFKKTKVYFYILAHSAVDLGSSPGQLPPCVGSAVWSLWTPWHLHFNTCFCDDCGKRKKVVEGYPPGTNCFVLEITHALLLLIAHWPDEYHGLLHKKGDWEVWFLYA